MNEDVGDERDPDVVTASVVAKRWGLDPRTVQRMVQNGTLPALQVKPGGKTLLSYQACMDALRSTYAGVEDSDRSLEPAEGEADPSTTGEESPN